MWERNMQTQLLGALAALAPGTLSAQYPDAPQIAKASTAILPSR